MMEKGNVYISEDGALQLAVRLQDNTAWMTIEQMAELFGKSRDTINEHIQSIYKDGDLVEERTKKDIGSFVSSNDSTILYNLDVILSVGYRVKSNQCAHFQKWVEDKSILKECKSLLEAFVKHVTIINANYLSKHLIGVIRQYLVSYRNPENNWYYKGFCADLDKGAKELIGREKEPGWYYVISTCFCDSYLCDLIKSFCIENDDFRGDDEERIQELEIKWKNEIASKYNRNEHLRRLIWDLTPFTLASKFFHLRSNVTEMIKEIIPFHVDIYSFVYCGLSCKCQEDNTSRVVITNCVGLFGDYVHYGTDKTLFPNQKVIEIPSKICSPGLREHMVVGISKGVFESLKETEVIKLPFSLENIEWSFWHCRKLRAIEVAKENKKFCSIDGVLFSKDQKVLYAYPNMHGKIYEVPEGVEIIEHFSFKDCDNLEMLFLPSSIKKIKKNALYRAINLKRVICSCKETDLSVDNPWGDFGNVNPQWFYSN